MTDRRLECGLEGSGGMPVPGDEPARRAVADHVVEPLPCRLLVGGTDEPPDGRRGIAEPGADAEGLRVGERSLGAVELARELEVGDPSDGRLRAIEADAQVASVTERLVARLPAAAEG